MQGHRAEDGRDDPGDEGVTSLRLARAQALLSNLQRGLSGRVCLGLLALLMLHDRVVVQLALKP